MSSSWSAIGIDLGATRLKTAVARGESSQSVSPTSFIPSALEYASGSLVVGAPALERATREPEAVVRGVESILARPRTTIAGHERPSDELLAALLGAGAEALRGAMGVTLEAGAIATRADLKRAPASEIVGRACDRAGFFLLGTASSTVAAAACYVAERRIASGTLAVLDAGATGAEIGLFRVRDETISVLGSAALADAGAQRVDEALVERLANELAPDVAPFLVHDPAMRESLRRACEDARVRIGVARSVDVPVPALRRALGSTEAPVWTVPREAIAEASEACFTLIEARAHKLLLETKVFWEGVQHLVLVGGFSRTRALRMRIEELFGLERADDVDVDGFAARGAALLAAWTLGDAGRRLDFRPDSAPRSETAPSRSVTPAPIAAPAQEKHITSPAIEGYPGVVEASRTLEPDAPPASITSPSSSAGRYSTPPPSSVGRYMTPPPPPEGPFVVRASATASTEAPPPDDAIAPPSSTARPSALPPRADGVVLARMTPREGARADRESGVGLVPGTRGDASSQRGSASAPARPESVAPPGSPSRPPPSIWPEEPETRPARPSARPRVDSSVVLSSSAPREAPPGAASSIRITSPDLSARIKPEGEFFCPTEAKRIASLPLRAALLDADLAPIALPVLLLRWVGQRDKTGVLELRRRDEVLSIEVIRGAPVATQRERDLLRVAFGWDRGSYRFVEDATLGRPSVTRKREPMITTVARGLRAMLRACDEQDLAAAIERHMVSAPVVAKDRAHLLDVLALSPPELRAIDAMFGGGFDTREIVRQGGLGKSSATQLLLMLDLFEVVRWAVPAKQDPDAALAQRTAARAESIGRANFFEALELHWSANAEAVAEAHARIVSEYGPGSAAARVAPDHAARIAARADEALQLLTNDQRRERYRAVVYPDLDPEAISDLLRRQSEALSMRGDAHDAKESQTLAREFSRAAAVKAAAMSASLPPPATTKKS